MHKLDSYYFCGAHERCMQLEMIRMPSQRVLSGAAESLNLEFHVWVNQSSMLLSSVIFPRI